MLHLLGEVVDRQLKISRFRPPRLFPRCTNGSYEVASHASQADHIIAISSSGLEEVRLSVMSLGIEDI